MCFKNSFARPDLTFRAGVVAQKHAPMMATDDVLHDSRLSMPALVSCESSGCWSGALLMIGANSLPRSLTSPRSWTVTGGGALRLSFLDLDC
eukprot:1667146-Amphidinium_carterae.1